ncbi:MAG: sigma-54-dependent Fis family transcriptional regulator [Acidipila sp.]|nr:sigma-54-dependent Fis family transcriptional regulator [Acidipila sp.]
MPAMLVQNVEERETLHRRQSLRVCVLDDDPGNLQTVVETLAHLGFAVSGTGDPNEALDAVRARRCTVVLSDVKMPEMDGLTFLLRAQAIDPSVEVVLMTGFYTLDSAINAIKKGAYDYITKPVDRVRLAKTLDELADHTGRKQRIREIEDSLLAQLEVHGIVGKSPALLEMFELAQKVAKHYTNVLIAGPTGSGKELVARAVHEMSPVARERFAICNCSALVDTLIESQLFGHVRGAFTGATETRPGLFEYADGGTLFLDEIAEMSVSTQAKLLRVIQNREIQRVGSPEIRRVDVRLIAATNRDLRAEVLAGRFREDLYYRLSTIEIRVPSLAERNEDILLLTQYFLKKFNKAYHRNLEGLSRRAQALLLQHRWPGNVRELENAISCACITATSDLIGVADLPEALRLPAPGQPASSDPWMPVSIAQVRQRHIERVLEMCGGNRLRSAEILGIGRTSLYRFLKRHDEGGRRRKSGRSSGGH